MEGENQKETRQKGGFWELVKSIIIALLIVIPIRAWVAQPFIVQGNSMLPNFHHGEYLIIDEFSYHFRKPERGEVVVFRYPRQPSQFFIKRVIGLPGDNVEIKDGSVRINGSALDEIYLPPSLATAPDARTVLGVDEYFILGDNRESSSDSRAWGNVKERFIVGRTLLRLWPLTRIEVL
jgi:signal peptidase I